MLDGIVERAVVARPGLDAVEHGRERTLLAEGDIGDGRSEHEVDLVEEVRHRLVHRGARCLDAHARLHVVHLLGHPQTERDLRCEVVGTLGIRITEVVADLGQARERPLQPEVRHLHRDVDARETGGLDERFGDVHDGRDHFGVDDRAAEIRRDHHAAPAPVVGTERGLPALDARQARRVTRVEPVRDVEISARCRAPSATGIRSKQ